MRSYLTTIRIVVIGEKKRKEEIISVDKDAEKSEPLYFTSRNAKWCSHMENH